MTAEQQLSHMQKALLAVDEIDRVAAARRPAYERRLEKAIREARTALMKLVGTSDEIASQKS